MGKSVKLTDGSYIDSEGIYDVAQSKTQKAINADVNGRLSGLYCVAWTNRTGGNATATISVGWFAPILLCVNQNGFANLYLCCTNRNNSMQVSTIVETRTGYTPTVSVTTNPNNMILSIPVLGSGDMWAITNRAMTFTVPS